MAKDYAVAIRGHYNDGVTTVSTLCAHVEVDGPDVSEASISEAGNAIAGWLGDPYRHCLPGVWTLDEIVSRELFDSTPAEHSVSVGAAGDLTASGAYRAAKELCVVLNVKSSVATRSGRGRMFFPSPLYDGYLGDQTNWLQSGNYWTKLGLFVDALLAGHDFTASLIDYHVSMRIHSRKLNDTFDVTSITRRPAYHWLRSRSTAP